MEDTTEKNLSLLVYHYLMEQRLGGVAEMFANKSPYLKDIERAPFYCSLTNTPLQSLREIVVDHETLLRSMKGLIRKYHEEAPLPLGKNTCDKIKFLLDYFYERAVCKGGDKTITECSGNPPSRSLAMNDAPVMKDVSVSCPEHPADHGMSPLQQVNQDSSSCNDTNQMTGSISELPPVLYLGCATSNRSSNQPITITINEDPSNLPCHASSTTHAVSSLIEQPHIYFEAPDAMEQVTKTTVVLTMEHTEVSSMRSVNKESTVTIVEEDVTHEQQTAPSMLIITPAPPSSPVNPPPPGQNTEQQYITVTANKENHEPENQARTVPTYERQRLEQDSSDAVIDLTETTHSLDDRTIEANPPTVPIRLPSETKKPHDPEALAAWRRLRMLNNSNFDDYIRDLNAAMVSKQQEQKKNVTAKVKATPAKQKSARKANQPIAWKKHCTRNASTKASAQKRKHENESSSQNGTPRKKRLAVTETKKRPAAISESSDFTSSAEEDEDIREMSRRVKQYRGQRKHNQTKEKTPEDLPGPSSSRLSRHNGFAGSSGRKATVRSCTNLQTTSTSPVSPSTKLAKSTIDSKAAHLRRRFVPPVGQQSATVRQPPGPDEPEPVASTSRADQPVRSCITNRKPREATVPPETPELFESNPNPVGEQQATPSNTTATAVDAGEAAIYAVLAQLHGDN
uniref:LisH domain-containing protein n=1 Tax=Anopheles culicifacies TaxID=139723 RepID=A0A182M3U6_9DIPT